MAIELIGNYNSSTYMDIPRGVDIVGNYAYITNAKGSIGTLTILDVTDKANPIYAGSFSTGTDGIFGIKVVGIYAFITLSGSNEMKILDVSNPVSILEVGVYTSSTFADGAWGIDVVGDYVFISGSNGRYITVIDISVIGSPTLADSYLYPIDNKPTYLKILGNYLYVVNPSNESFEIFDISIPTNISLEGTVSTLGSSGLDVLGNYAYICGEVSDTLEVINIEDPTAPVVVGSFSDIRYTEGINSVKVVGDYAFIISFYSNNITKLNVSDIQDIQVEDSYKDLAFIDTPTILNVTDQYCYVGANVSNSFTILDLSSIVLDKSIVSIGKSRSIKINATIFPPDAVITWSSDNIISADVDSNGLVTTYKRGTAIITASITGASATCIINVGGKMQSAGLYDVYLTNLSTGTETFLGDTPQDGAFVFSMQESAQEFMTKGGGIAPTEARVIVGKATLTIDLILERALEQEIYKMIYATSATKTTFGMNQGCEKKYFSVRMHPKCENMATLTYDINFLKAYLDITDEVTATIDGKKLIKVIINGMNVETTLPAPADLTLTAGSGAAKVLYWKAVATNSTGISVLGSELSSTLADDKINFTLPVGATGLTLYAGEATGPATSIKSWQVTDAEITAGLVADVGTLYDGATMTSETALPAAATGYYYKSVEIGG